MVIAKDQILEEIRRTTTANAGVPLGLARFHAETGIRRDDCIGVYWAKWSDAIVEAGFAPNQMTGAFADDVFIRAYAELARRIGHFPSKPEMQMERRRSATFPNWNSFIRRFGSVKELRERVVEFCAIVPDFEALAEWHRQELRVPRDEKGERAAPPASLGYVYLLKHGKRREFKIGHTKNALRRHGEIKLELPEAVQPVHVINTDDPSGIEAYWHRRFEAKRKNGEWFELSVEDVAAFRRRKFM